MPTRILRSTILVLGALLMLASAANAGKYHVYSCRTPAGASAPADGWSGTKEGTRTYKANTCQTGGALVAALEDQTIHTANADIATWAFGVPMGEQMVGATLWRAGGAYGPGTVNAIYGLWFAGPEHVDNPANAFGQCFGTSTWCLSGVENPVQAFSAENRLAVAAQHWGAHLYLSASCSGESGFTCPAATGDANNYAAVVYLYAADITLEQTAGPSIGPVSGELASAPSVGGTSDIVLSASDPGSGVYEAVFSADGNVVQSTVLNDNGGKCRNVGETSDGLPAFLYTQPCIGALSATSVGFDTTRLANGAHHLIVNVLDAAGNASTALDRTVTVSNPSPLAAGSGALTTAVPGLGAVNGVNASAQATLTVAWKGTKGPRLVCRYGHVATIEGRLNGPGGLPIMGAQVEVLAMPAYSGAKALAMTAVKTDAAGRFSLRLPSAVSSRTLRFAYRTHVGDAIAAATRSLTLAVRAGVSMKISPHTASVGHRITFSGRLLGMPIPRGGKQLVLEARSGGGSWIQFHVIRTDSHGRLRATYRFRLPGPAVYQFRVHSEVEADYPYASGDSNTVTVHER
ncbi:MAG: hypothetical protein QOI03_231 [Solirubrobacteraceae bacterium]|nr:hypothetical protein [Solirubrobacteraceae bacterium]